MDPVPGAIDPDDGFPRRCRARQADRGARRRSRCRPVRHGGADHRPSPHRPHPHHASCEVAADFAISVLRPGGHFLAKAFQGGTENDAARPAQAQFPLRPPRQAAGLARRIGGALSAGEGFQGQGGGGERTRPTIELLTLGATWRMADVLAGSAQPARRLRLAGWRIAWPETELPASGASRRNGMAASAVIAATIMKAVEKAGAPSGCAGDVGEAFEDHAGDRDAERHADLLRHRRDRCCLAGVLVLDVGEHQRIGRGEEQRAQEARADQHGDDRPRSASAA